MRAPGSNRANMHRDPNAESGFSLIEVMIATALLSAIGGLMVSMLWLTIDGQRTVRDTRDRLHAARVALNTMSREISMAFLTTHVDEEERRQSFFDGDSTQLDFTTLAYRRLVQNAKESEKGKIRTESLIWRFIFCLLV